MNTIARTIATALIGTALGLSAATAGAATLRVATEGAYPPFNFVDSSGKLQGFDVEIADALCKEMKADCTISAQAWDGMIPGLNANQFDLIVASMSITPERLKAVNFSKPYYQAGAALVAAKDSDLQPEAKSLAGKLIGVQRASTYARLLEAKFPQAEVRLYDKTNDHNLDLATNRIDGVIAQRIIMSEWLASSEGADFEIKGKAMLDPEIIGEGAGIAMRKSDDQLREQVNTALAAIMNNGVYDQINAKYFPFSLKPEN